MSVHTHAYPVTGPRPLHQFPTCCSSLNRLCDLWCRPPRDFNLHRDKCNKRNNLEIRAKEDTFTNPSPKVGWGCHHVICAGDEAGRGREGDRELEKAAGLGKRKHPHLSPPHPLLEHRGAGRAKLGRRRAGPTGGHCRLPRHDQGAQLNYQEHKPEP